MTPKRYLLVATACLMLTLTVLLTACSQSKPPQLPLTDPDPVPAEQVDPAFRQFPVVSVSAMPQLDTPKWSLHRKKGHYEVYVNLESRGDDPKSFVLVNRAEDSAIEITAYGCELGDDGVAYVSDTDYTLIRVDQQGHVHVLFSEKPAVGNLAYNSDMELLAFEAAVTYPEGVRGVALLSLRDGSCELVYHRQGPHEMYNVYVLWWDEDNSIIINELDYYHGFFLQRQDLEGQRSELVSFDDLGIPIFGRRLYSEANGRVAMVDGQTQTIRLFDVYGGSYVTFAGYISARWNRDMELLGLRPDGEEKVLLSAR